jgi:prepilin-type processing-associated H-X9-DG protein
MANYLLIDGHVVLSTPEAKRWLHRAIKQVPLSKPEDAPDAVAMVEREKSDYEIIEGLEEDM